MSDLRDSLVKIIEDFKFDETDYNEVNPWIIADEIISMVLDELKEKTLNLKAGKHNRRVFLQLIEDTRNE